MTRKELVEALTANFAEDEEVTFVYNDDQGEVRKTDVEIRDHEQEKCVGHWECNGVRVDYPRIKEMYRAGKGLDGRHQSYEEIRQSLRWVDDGPPVKDVKRVVYVG